MRSPFQARDLAVPMADAVKFPPDAGAAGVRRELEARKFDQAPVVDGTRPIGFVLTRHIQPTHRAVSEALIPLGSGNVVSADADVGDLLEWIIRPGFLFVLEGREVTGFITVHDFNKQPARAHLYLLLARLESALAQLVRHHFGERIADSLVLLSAPSRNAIEQNYGQDVDLDAESDLVAYLTFADLITIVGRETAILARLGGMSRTSWSNDTGGLAELRNHVMHPVRNVVLTKEGLVRLHRRERRIRELIALTEAARHKPRPGRDGATSETVMLIRIAQLYRPDMTDIELYEATRGVWRVGPRRDEVRLALAVAEGVVIEVYEIDSWHPIGATRYATRSIDPADYPGRWEFTGRVADQDDRAMFLGHSTDGVVPRGAQNPILYAPAHTLTRG